VKSSLELRAPTPADAGVIAELCNALTRNLYSDGDADESAVAHWFQYPNLAMFLAERDGRPLGYADVNREASGEHVAIDIRVHPESRGSGVAEALLAAAEDWAREHAEPGALARAWVPERDSETQELLGRRGYKIIRHSLNMEIELTEQPEFPEWPSGVAVRTFDRARDEEAVYECLEETFSDHWDHRPTPIEEWRAFAFDERHDPTLWWLADENRQLAGVCLNAWHFSGDPGFGWVGSLGVRRPWRRRGLGLALLLHSFLDFKRRGATRVGLGVDAENLTGAVRLYERAGMRPVRRYDTYERKL
jgi:mycothiol synthase